MTNKKEIAIIGGAGHIGTPLGINLSKIGFKTILIDNNLKNIKLINNGKMPFFEIGSEKILKRLIKEKKLVATNMLQKVENCKTIIICIGTPINKNNHPELENFFLFFYNLKKYLKKNHHVIVRSSIFPGTIDKIKQIIGKNCNLISYCPERIAQGYSLVEQGKISQIVAGINEKSFIEAKKIFFKISGNILKAKIEEAELIKLFSNAYRYSHFSLSNLMYMMCEEKNLNFPKIRKLMVNGYDRNKSIPYSGFVSGPCLFKDTMQLSSYYKNSYKILENIRKINEGLPNFVFKNLNKKYDLKKKKIGVLGLTFKPESDDVRDSLPMKMVKLLKSKKIKVFCSDQYFKNKDTCSLRKLIKESDIIIIGTEHKIYKKIKFPKTKIVVDIGGYLEEN